ITTDTVSLIDENGAECRIADVAYDSGANTVIIKTEKALLADLDYRVVISADAKLTEDIMIGEEVSADFRTAPNDISVTAAEISPDAEECTARVSVKNTSEENKTVYVAMTLWNKNRGVDMRIMPIAIEAKAVKSVTLRAERQDADAAEIYVYSDMMASEFLSSRIYRKEF
ncbi:MAG: hypothetical protein Q4E94_03430, partial [Clostridia bacterium]|nr:hypothetical protein [Clostridia bacterium]